MQKYTPINGGDIGNFRVGCTYSIHTSLYTYNNEDMYVYSAILYSVRNTL